MTEQQRERLLGCVMVGLVVLVVVAAVVTMIIDGTRLY